MPVSLADLHEKITFVLWKCCFQQRNVATVVGCEKLRQEIRSRNLCFEKLSAAHYFCLFLSCCTFLRQRGSNYAKQYKARKQTIPIFENLGMFRYSEYLHSPSCIVLFVFCDFLRVKDQPRIIQDKHCYPRSSLFWNSTHQLVSSLYLDYNCFKVNLFTRIITDQFGTAVDLQKVKSSNDTCMYRTSENLSERQGERKLKKYAKLPITSRLLSKIGKQ